MPHVFKCQIQAAHVTEVSNPGPIENRSVARNHPTIGRSATIGYGYIGAIKKSDFSIPFYSGIWGKNSGKMHILCTDGRFGKVLCLKRNPPPGFHSWALYRDLCLLGYVHQLRNWLEGRMSTIKNGTTMSYGVVLYPQSRASTRNYESLLFILAIF